MEVMKLMVHLLILTECYHSTKAMGLCDFAEKFPCEESGGSACFTSSGCKGQIFGEKIKPSPTTGHTTTDKVTNGTTTNDQVSTRHLTTDQVTSGQATTDQVTTGHETADQVTDGQATTGHAATGHATTGHAATGHETTNQVTTGQVTADQVTEGKTTTDEVTTSHATTNEVNSDHATTDQVISTIPLCPPNMAYVNCTTCQSTCIDPIHCISNCTEPETCVCPAADGFLLKGDNCVPEEQCGCFIEGVGVVPEGGFYVTSNCSTRCNCSAGRLACDDDYQCSTNALCDERDNSRQCYCNTGYTGDGVTCTSSSTATDCLDVFSRGNTSNGVYNITPTTWSGSPFEVYCNMTDGGGWTVFQRRVDDSVDFNVYWDDYKNGFGSPDHGLWLGNEKTFSLTNQRPYQLRIDFVDSDGDPYYAKYDFFRISNETNNYRLTVENYTDGDAGDSLTYHNNEDFSTQDEDNDNNSNIHWAGADPYYGAWWYGYDGYYSFLNGDYYTGGIYWKTLPGDYYNIKYIEMKVRPV